MYVMLDDELQEEQDLQDVVHYIQEENNAEDGEPDQESRNTRLKCTSNLKLGIIERWFLL